ncbi:chromosome partitioning protein ParB [Sphingomonas glacialis]|uniref:Chromosome partitioning protein ParB n=1 Tax=Sphingomonas glacialis TaxID=658225 RepID=A0ABQ3LU48_9SPHN|nr:ParB-like protein [Sphingomonas glacialis]GHH26166.1 chromosome partitioning protein ParB [Sphingomonas glacialis]
MSDTTLGIALEDLRPTQMTVGYREIATKRREWHDAGAKDRIKLLRKHIVPAVIGPKGRPYIVDHHHFVRALLEEGVNEVGVYIVADLSHLAKDEFWTFLDNSAWCHAYDADGERRALSKIPNKMSDLKDDPYRSLVGALIRAGGCAKTSRPFFEFLWADFLRRRIKRSLIDGDFDEALAEAMNLAGSDSACSLPGWCKGRKG